MTETKTLTFFNLEVLERYFARYVAEGWQRTSDVKTKFSWKLWRQVVTIDICREKPEEMKIFTETIENKSDLNPHKQVFTYGNRKGSLFKKEFYYNAATFDVNTEFNEWKRQIIAQHGD